MGLDIFPLLKDHTCLILYNNTIFKLKLEYQELSQQTKEAFIQVTSEEAAHSQIEDACRALLYIIEREKELSPLQTHNFIIYPQVHTWPLVNRVQFIIDGKQLSCYSYVLLLKVECKIVTLDSTSSANPRHSNVCVEESHQENANSHVQAANNLSYVDVAGSGENVNSANTNITHDTAAVVTRGGGLLSNDKITLIQKHSKVTQMATMGDNSNFSNFKAKRSEICLDTCKESNVCSQSKHTQTNEKRDNSTKLFENTVQSLNKTVSRNTGIDWNSSGVHNSPQNIDQLKQSDNQSPQQRRNAINMMLHKVKNVPCGEMSDSEDILDRSANQRDKSRADSVSVRTVHSKVADKYYDVDLRGSGNKLRKHNISERTDGAESSGMKNTVNVSIYERTRQKQPKILLSTHSMKQTSKTASAVIKNPNTEYKSETTGRKSRRMHMYRSGASITSTGTESESNQDLPSKRKNLVVSGNDTDESSMSNVENVTSVAILRHKTRRRKKTSSLEFTKYVHPEESEFSQDSVDVMPCQRSKSKQFRRVESDDGMISTSGQIIYSKTEGKQRNKTSTSDQNEQSKGSVHRQRGHCYKEKKNLIDETQSEGSSKNSVASRHVSNKGNTNSSVLLRKGSCLTTLEHIADKRKHSARLAARYALKAVNDHSSSSSSQENAQKHKTGNRKFTTHSGSYLLLPRNKHLNIMMKKSVLSDPHKQRLSKISPRDCLPKAIRSLAGSPSLLEYEGSRFLRSKTASLIRSTRSKTGERNIPSYIAETNRTFREAQQRLLDAKDGVWLFWKSSTTRSKKY